MTESFDIARFLRREYKFSQHAVDCLFAHGQVSIDGHVLGSSQRVLPTERLRGRMLKAGRIETRLIGSRAADIRGEEGGQLSLGP